MLRVGSFKAGGINSPHEFLSINCTVVIGVDTLKILAAPILNS